MKDLPGNEPVGAGRGPESEEERLLIADLRRVVAARDARRAAWEELDVAPVLDRYRVTRRIGAGGMGVVFAAEQTKPARTVALKVLRAGPPSGRLVQRFAWESEILGRLDHPNIAKVFEAGSYDTARGPRPYFAMELVDGEPITAYAGGRGLDRRGRLGLFRAVCAAVRHAHRKGVIHRDLKPANILVGADGVPKVLDFGVARLVEEAGGGDGDAPRTLDGQIVGTLESMSPEQVGGAPGAVDTRADVYALGVLLYELLAGRPPLELASLPPAAALRAIEREEPPRLGALDPSLKGDLETIAAKALEKDPERRYASVEALDDDVGRFLRHEPIAARPPSGLYVLGRLARRHRGLAGGLVAFLLAAALGTAGTWRQAVRARAAESEARAQAGKAALVAKLVVGAVGSASEAFPVPDARPALQAELQRGLREAAAELGALAPREEADLRGALGAALLAVGDHAGAAAELRASLAALDRLEAARVGAFERPALQVQLATALQREGADDSMPRARELAGRALEDLDSGRGQPPPNPQQLDSWRVAARAVLARTALSAGALEEARVEARAAYELAQGLPEERDGPLLAAANGELLAGILGELGRYGEALEVARDASARARAALGDADWRVGLTALRLARLAAADELWAEAGRSAEEAHRALATSFGPAHVDTLRARLVHARAASATGRHAEAEHAAREALAALDAVDPGDEWAVRGHALGVLARAAAARGDAAGARDLHAGAVAAFERRRPPEHRDVLRAKGDLAAFLQAAGELDAAAALQAEIAAAVARTPELPPRFALGLANNGATLLALRERWEEALPLFELALARKLELFDPGGDSVAVARSNLAKALVRVGRPAEAEEPARAALEAWSAVFGEDSVKAAIARHNLAEALHGLGRADEAGEHAAAALAVFGRELGPDARRTADARALLDAIGPRDAADGRGE